jgi:hypothetical protein
MFLFNIEFSSEMLEAELSALLCFESCFLCCNSEKLEKTLTDLSDALGLRLAVVF